MSNKNTNYDDIIDLPHHVSKVHPHLSMKDRAAQFSPFAALTGHSEAMDETARLTSRKIELSDDEKTILDRRLQAVIKSVNKDITFSFTYFVPDLYKDGGSYKISSGKVIKINMTTGYIYLDDDSVIHIKDLIKIDSDAFNKF